MQSSSKTPVSNAPSPLDNSDPFLNKIKFPGNEIDYIYNHLDFEYVDDIHVNGNCTVKHYKFKPFNDFPLAVKGMHIPHNRNQKRVKEKRFKQIVAEVRIFRTLPRSPYIVDFYGICKHEGQARICMELMDLSLDDLYRRAHDNLSEIPKLPEDIIGIINYRIFDALVFCMENNIIHRDVKPRNILIKQNGKVKLCDFGESKVLYDSLTSTCVGTLWYWPPEKFGKDGDRRSDIRSDIWSLGITVGEIVCGSLPFPRQKEEKKENIVLVQELILNTNPMKHIEPFLTHYSPQMRDFVQTCLVKEVKDRPSYDQLAKMDFYTLYSNMADNDARLEKFMEPLILREDKTDEHPDSPSPIAEVDNNP